MKETDLTKEFLEECFIHDEEKGLLIIVDIRIPERVRELVRVKLEGLEGIS